MCVSRLAEEIKKSISGLTGGLQVGDVYNKWKTIVCSIESEIPPVVFIDHSRDRDENRKYYWSIHLAVEIQQGAGEDYERIDQLSLIVKADWPFEHTFSSPVVCYSMNIRQNESVTDFLKRIEALDDFKELIKVQANDCSFYCEET